MSGRSGTLGLKRHLTESDAGAEAASDTSATDAGS